MDASVPGSINALPAELLLEICQYLEKTKDLQKFRLINQATTVIGAQKLFESVRFLSPPK